MALQLVSAIADVVQGKSQTSLIKVLWRQVKSVLADAKRAGF